MKAKCITAVAPNKVVVEDVILDETAIGEDELLINSQCSLTNPGTEVATFTGLEAEFSKTFKYPCGLGRANVGTVQKTGSKVRDLAAGDLVLSFGPHASAFKTNRAGIISKVPPEIEPASACFARMASVSITALRKADLGAGDKVLINGQGVVGNLAAQLFRLAGAEVMVADINEFRLQTARQCGLARTVNPARENLKEVISSWTDAKGPRIIVDAVGQSELILAAVELVARSGQVILLGTPRKRAETEVTRMLARIHTQDITLRGAYLWDFPRNEDPYARYSIAQNVEEIFGWIRDGRLNPKPLCTHTLPPEQCQQAYDGLSRDKEHYLAVIFNWN